MQKENKKINKEGGDIVLYTTEVWLETLEEPRRAGESRIVGKLVTALLSSWSLGSSACPSKCLIWILLKN